MPHNTVMLTFASMIDLENNISITIIQTCFISFISLHFYF